jgi:uncharacterized repeat protein (TIGR03803 family)
MSKLSLWRTISLLCVFCAVEAITSRAQTLKTLVNFDGTNGSNPAASLIQGTDGNFYGTASRGGTSSACGTSGCGTVFKITPAGKLTTLRSFDHTDGNGPSGLVQAIDGNFYGTTYAGGASGTACLGIGCGTVFKITLAGNLTTLHSFDYTDGGNPSALVQATDGNFYGTTYEGGASSASCSSIGCGTVFKISQQAS